MINHARTLLVNRSGGKQSLAELGEEYIPEKFVKQELPSWLRLVWEALFGSAPENIFINYQIDRLLKVVHTTDYEPYLFEHDSRITYDPTAPGDFSDADYGISFTSTDVTAVNIVGDLTANEVLGVAKDRWELLVYTTGEKNISAKNIRTNDIKVTPGASLTTLSEPVTLPGTSMKVRVTKAIGAVPDPIVVDLEALAKPTEDLTIKIANIEKLGESIRNLFGATANEPYLTFYGLWKQNASFPDKVAGLILAMVFRLNDMMLAEGTAR